MKAIFKREFKSFFTSPIGFVFIAANLLLIGIYFTAYNLQGTYPYFSYTVSSSVIIYFVTVPLLTMRSLAEERKNKTDQLILTAPVSVGKIVLGKFLALAAMLGIVAAIICFYPLIMRLYGDIPMKETYVGILGFYLYGLAGAAVGMLISSITESQIIAAVLSFAFMFISYFMSGIISIISTTENLFTKILSSIDFVSRLDSFINGSLDLTSVIYFISFAALMLFLTSQSIQKRRYSISAQNFSLGAYSSVAIIVAIAVAVLVNIICGQIPKRYVQFDMTDNKLYSLTEESKEMLKALDKDVKLYVYCKEDNYDTTCKELLSRYEGMSSKVTVEYINPSLYPTFVQTYTTSSVTTGSIIVVSSDKSKVIDYNDLYESTTSMDYTTYSYVTNTTGFDAEGQITSAIAFVTGEEMPTVYYTGGHGELEMETILTDAISKANMDTQAITLITDGEIPEDAELLLINNPTGDFSEDDCKFLEDYISTGGNVVINLYANGTEQTNLWGTLAKYGVTVKNAIVMEADKNHYYTYPLYLLPNIASDTVTSSVYGTYYIFAPYTLSMNVNETLPDNVSVTQLLYTSDSAYSKDTSKEITTYEKEEGDAEGPFTVSAKIVVSNEDGSQSTIIVNACGDMFTDSANSMVSGANAKFFAGILTEVSDLSLTVSIPVKSLTAEYLSLTTAQISMWRTLVLVVLPVGFVIAGIVIWVRRRKM